MRKHDKKVFLIALIWMSLTLVYIIYLRIAYKGLDDSLSLIGAPIAVVILWYLVLFVNDNLKYWRLRVLPLMIVTIGMPIFLIITKPTYSYAMGQEILMDYLGDNEEHEVILSEQNKYTITVKTNSRGAVLQENYYYHTRFDGEDDYYMVDATKGKVTQVEEDSP